MDLFIHYYEILFLKLLFILNFEDYRLIDLIIYMILILFIMIYIYLLLKNENQIF